MKFGYNLINLEKHISVWDGAHTCMGYLEVLKVLQDHTHTPSLNLRDHVPNISATMVYGMGVWVKCMGGYIILELITKYIHLCAVVRGTCPCVLVRKCVMDRELESIFSRSHIRS